MLRRGKEEDKKVIFDMYAKSGILNLYNQDDYFSDSFIAQNVIVNEINGHVVSSLQINYHQIIFNDLKIVGGVIFGQFYERNKGIKTLENLRAEVLEQQTHKTLFTLIPTDNIQEYAKYGFEPIYSKRIYNISRKDVKNVSYQGVGKQFQIDDLVKVYKTFTEKFAGYFLRNKQYYLDLIDLLQSKRYNLAAYYNENDDCQGYMIYYIESNKVVIKELIYLNGLALTKLLSYALRIKPRLLVYVSQNEDLSKAYPKINYKLLVSMAVRINDFELFNRLFDCDVSTAQQAYQLEKKPLFLNDLRY
ncbi:MAG: hypothetical protein Q4C64_07450 [Erysipelotrichia bacterium]|nr:hypothetical protein [Erysipelotrichia bacterium]